MSYGDFKQDPFQAKELILIFYSDVTPKKLGGSKKFK